MADKLLQCYAQVIFTHEEQNPLTENIKILGQCLSNCRLQFKGTNSVTLYSHSFHVIAP